MVCAQVQRSARIEGGFVLVAVTSLIDAWRKCRAKPLGIGDFRTWLACREMVARRCLAREGRAVAYDVPELASILNVTEKRARASIRRLQNAGLISWSESALGFADPGGEPIGLDDTIGRGRGAIVVPRRILRRLAQGAPRVLVATVLGILFRCLSRRQGGFDGRGRVKASWIARTFDVHQRRVKQARRELVALGWIEPETSSQLAENKWGRVYRIDLAWDQPDKGAGSEGPSLPPPPAAERPEFATPSVNQDPLRERIQNQEPARGPAGVEIQKQETQDKPPPAPTLADVRVEDLKDTGRLLQLHDQAVAKGLVTTAEADRLRVVAAAEHALAVGQANPAGLFAYLIRGRCWRYLTVEDEDRANARIKVHLRGPELPRVESASIQRPARPMMSEDARLVIRVRSALAAKNYRGDPFPQVRRLDPSWTRQRWDKALAELGEA